MNLAALHTLVYPFIALAVVGVVFIIWGIKVLRSDKAEAFNGDATEEHHEHRSVGEPYIPTD